MEDTDIICLNHFLQKPVKALVPGFTSVILPDQNIHENFRIYRGKVADQVADQKMVGSSKVAGLSKAIGLLKEVFGQGRIQHPTANLHLITWRRVICTLEKGVILGSEGSWHVKISQGYTAIDPGKMLQDHKSLQYVDIA